MKNLLSGLLNRPHSRIGISGLTAFARLAAGACGCATLFGGSLHAQSKQPLDWAKARDVAANGNVRTEIAAAKPMLQQLSTMAQPLGAVRPSTGNSLYTKSIILFDGETHTLIPIGAVLHLPENLRNRVITKPQGNFTYWPNFLKRNATWLGTKEVPLKMARGDTKLAEDVLRETSGSNRLLVSVYRECPISVLEAPRR
ncbi:MAG: hypothetical protein U0984_09285 [Prosthecobacter sp.]|nr:hypothetical protein [Prosthecobacter sp.]